MNDKRALISYLLGKGIKIRPQALDYLMSYAQHKNYDSEEQLDDIISDLGKFDVVDVDQLQSVIQETPSSAIKESKEIVVIDVFKDLPKYIFNSNEKFVPASPPSFLGAPLSKHMMYRERFAIARSRIKKHKTFNPSLNESAIPFSEVESLIGCNNEKIILGMLTKIDGKTWYLEDFNGTVKLDIYDVEKNSGFFCEGCIVLAQGRHVDGVLYVSCIAQPPACSIYADVDIFGGEYLIEQRKGTESLWTCQWPDNCVIVALSNVHLNDPRVMRLLDKLFAGYAAFSNILFVLMGNFSSEPQANPYNHKNLFTNLANLIGKYPNLQENAMWVFIPGPNDPGLGLFLPQQKLPNNLTEAFESLKHWKSSSNPTRILFCGKKLIFAKIDQLRTLQRNSAVEPNFDENANPDAHLAHTILKQGHLCPTLHTQVLPDYDHTLRIESQPDLICLADNTRYFNYSIDDSKVVNPGHFSRYSTFVAISGISLKVQLCDISE
ncbi:unnamed protein product [Blepharisma stoltei]|uniref:DNA polymerase epsilon subunit n=1 Tax=Blepharisma stoltei TaxID=1481888 RepID=A0AAU9KCU3_9CILI|nr:unnamed protein product [Blepharisma stoltei]